MNGDILFLAHRQPFPPNRGDSIRSWNILKALTKLAPVHLVSFADSDPDTLQALQGVCASVHLIRDQRSRTSAMAAALLSGRPASVEMFRSSAFQAAVDHVLSEHHIATVYAFSGQMGQYVSAVPRSVRFIMDFTDVDSEKFAAYGRTAGGFAGLANRFEARRLLAFELQIANRADINLFVSSAEEQLFRQLTGSKSLQLGTLENGVDLDRFAPSLEAYDKQDSDTPQIAFTGQMDYPPNIDAVTFFAQEVLPIVRERQADAQFAIIGRAPTSEVLQLAGLPGVTVTGEVSDTRPWLAKARVVVAPLRIARGIQNKVLEAMASAKAVVASPEAAEGIEACHGKELLIAGSASAQADAVVSLLHDSGRRKRMELAARAAMEARYSWDAKMAPLAEYVCPSGEQAAA
jgi:sugar transferase (PEP-CTERM/EpsH1 system associated)